MTSQGLPLDYDIVIYAGTSYRREFRWLPDGATTMDFTGWDAHMYIGQPLNVADVELNVTGGELLLTNDGQIVITMDPTRTASLLRSTTWYNLDLTEPDGFVRRFLRGRVSVVFDVRAPVP